MGQHQMSDTGALRQRTEIGSIALTKIHRWRKPAAGARRKYRVNRGMHQYVSTPGQRFDGLRA